MKKVVRLTESELVYFVKRVLKEQSDYNVSPQDLINLSKDIVSKLGEIEHLIKTEKSKLKYKLKNFFKKIIKSNRNLGFEEFFRRASMEADPISSLIDQYNSIVRRHNNGLSRVNLNEMGYENMISLYNEMNVFKRRLEGLEILIRGGIIDDYSDLSA